MSTKPALSVKIFGRTKKNPTIQGNYRGFSPCPISNRTVRGALECQLSE
jgi:hypothetical protein